MKVANLQMKSANKELLKHISTIYIIFQLWVLVVPHIRTLVIYCQNIWFYPDFKHIPKKVFVLLSYINRVKYRHGIGIPTTYGYQYCADKTCFNVRSMFSLSYFTLPVLNNILHIFLRVHFVDFTCLLILEVDIIRIKCLNMENI